MHNPERLLPRSVFGGLLVWFAAFGLWWQRPPDLLATVMLLLLLAILVNVPLALSLLTQQETASQWSRWAVTVQPFAALAVAAVSIGLSRWAAVTLSALWLLFVGLLAISALRRLPTWRRLTAPVRVRLVAMLYLPIGAAWLVAYQLGLQPLGFSGIIVLLTAVHFHFTGFAATVWASKIGERLPASRSYPWFAGAFVLATPLIAVGITLSPLLEIGGVLLLTTALLGLAVLFYRHALPTVTKWPAKVLLSIAPLAMVVAITLAVLYGLGEYLETPLLTIPQMVQWHGWLNAVGFTFCGLLGWRLAEQAQTVRQPAETERRSSAQHVL
jgi:hypothetical protein